MMSKHTKNLVYGGVLAALYVALTYAQNLLWPGSTTMAIQMRLSEALCIFAFFTPAAIPGLTLGWSRTVLYVIRLPSYRKKRGRSRGSFRQLRNSYSAPPDSIDSNSGADMASVI